MECFLQITNKHIENAKREKLDSDKVHEQNSKPSLLRYLVNSDLPESELSVERLSKEAQVLLGAGTVSTARTLDFICYYVISNKTIHQKLQDELRGIMKNYPAQIPSYVQLEKLPYLSALVKEGLRYVCSCNALVLQLTIVTFSRLSFGNMHRLPRVSPDSAIQYKEWVIPVGVCKYRFIERNNADLFHRFR